MVTEESPGALQASQGVTYITGSGGAILHLERPSSDGANLVDQSIERSAIACPDVHYSPGDELGRTRSSENVGLDHVVDEREVTGLFAIAENGDRGTLDRGLEEQRHDGRVLREGALPGSKHVEISQSNALDQTGTRIGEHVLLARKLRCGVRGARERLD